jgi:hypothetical protein
MIAKVEAIYRPIIQKMGVNLVISKDWATPEVNAWANLTGNTLEIHMMGGLARRGELSKNSLYLVVCHEIGHFAGGWVTYPSEWASAESQSDRFATSVCAKKVFANFTENAQMLSKIAVDKCKSMYKGQALRVCYLTGEAAKGLGDLLGSLSGERVSYNTPDMTVVRTTETSYPRTNQCRLDEMLAGALCKAPWDDAIIPSQQNQARYTCTLTEIDKRRTCWFKP